MKPSLSLSLPPIWQPCVVLVPDKLPPKLQESKSRDGIFIRYLDEKKDRYRVWDPLKQQVITTRDLEVDEGAFLQIAKL